LGGLVKFQNSTNLPLPTCKISVKFVTYYPWGDGSTLTLTANPNPNTKNAKKSPKI